MNKLPKLTRKQQVFVTELLEKPKQPAVHAALAAYGKPGKELAYDTANAIAVENLQKPSIMEYLTAHSKDAENTVLEVMNMSRNKADRSPAYATVALTAAKDVLDRVHGKATQRTEVTTTGVQVTIDLSGSSLSNDDNE